MTVLRDGTVVDESITAHNFTRAADVPATFRNGKRIVKNITIHHWGDPGQNFDAVVRYLASNNARGSSAHAVIMAKRATSIVSPDDAAWHAGNPIGATVSIGLELRPEATDGDYITAAAYIAMLREVYGDIPLVPHNYWKATACPGKWDLARLDRMARQGVTVQDDDDMAAPTAKEIVDEMMSRPIKRMGSGVPAGNLNLSDVIGYYDYNITVTQELVKQLAVKQGVTIDYDAIAKAVNDDAARRQAE